jgi:hypothetical protein
VIVNCGRAFECKQLRIRDDCNQIDEEQAGLGDAEALDFRLVGMRDNQSGARDSGHRCGNENMALAFDDAVLLSGLKVIVRETRPYR